MEQIIHQLCVLRFGLALYIAAAETGILYMVIVRCQANVLERESQELTTIAAPIVAWAHGEQPSIPSYVKSDCKDTLNSRLEFFKIIGFYLKSNGPLPPIKLFKYGAQSFYSKAKGGVDGATQQRALLRFSIFNFQYKQKIVSQTIKS